MNKNALITLMFFSFLAPPIWANSYYLATAVGGGSDSNSGLSASTPWLTPKHALNCGDVIIAAASTTYASTNFQYGSWGTVTGSGHCVAWLQCVTFDACKITSSTGFGMWVTASHWGVRGWEITADTGGGGSGGTCFEAYPPTSSANLQDIIFANDIADGCYGAGFEPVPHAPAGVDYFVVVASIAYNAAQQTSACGSGISIFEPVQTDMLAGTHIYVSQTFTWDNFDPNPCAGGPPTDGEGIIFDTWSNFAYSGQGVMENNIAFLNGGHGFEVWNNTLAPVYIVNNTSFGNNADINMNASWCGEIQIAGPGSSSNTHVYNNISSTNAALGCGANAIYAFYAVAGNSTDIIQDNIGYSAVGYNDICVGSCTGFTFGPGNSFGTNPTFVSAPASNPGVPKCDGYASVIACMAPIIADFTTQTHVMTGIGYQPVQDDPAIDPYFPQWLCNVGLPAGLVTMGCQTTPQPPTNLTVTVT